MPVENICAANGEMVSFPLSFSLFLSRQCTWIVEHSGENVCSISVSICEIFSFLSLLPCSAYKWSVVLSYHFSAFSTCKLGTFTFSLSISLSSVPLCNSFRPFLFVHQHGKMCKQFRFHSDCCVSQTRRTRWFLCSATICGWNRNNQIIFFPTETEMNKRMCGREKIPEEDQIVQQMEVPPKN